VLGVLEGYGRIAEAAHAARLREYSDSQPRDPNGRWSGGGTSREQDNAIEHLSTIHNGETLRVTTGYADGHVQVDHASGASYQVGEDGSIMQDTPGRIANIADFTREATSLPATILGQLREYGADQHQ